MNYRIITDSCCDLSDTLIGQLDITAVPLTLLFRGQEQDDANGDQLKTLYNALRQGESASTSAINPQRWTQAIEPLLQQGLDALVLAFSSGLSTTYQSAVIAAEELAAKYPQRTVKVVDTLCASMGQGLLVWYACQKRNEGMSLEALADWCEREKTHLCHWFTVDDLMYLKRGGRVSAATALVGTMLQIKPVMHVDDAGKLIKVTTARGRKASLDALASKLKALGGSFDNSTVFISHGDCLEDAQYLAEKVKAECGVKEVIIGYVGAVIGSHAGPGVVAFFFLGDHR